MNQEMEEKESTMSGSPENTDSGGSPTPISQAPNHQASAGAGPTPAPPSDGASAAAVKKKRGRPRKYDADGNLNPAYAARMAAAPVVSPPPGFTLTVAGQDFGPRRGRGRGGVGSAQAHFHHHHHQPNTPPLGELFAQTAGGDFTPHVITVQTGEDVANTIFSFSQKGPTGICVLAANGAVSSVTLRQPGSSSLMTYEGRFEILSLTGSYTVSEADGVKSRSGGLSISLAGSDGRVFGGGVAGWLTAASPIQVVLGSFTPMGYKAQKRKYTVRESPTAAAAFPAVPETVVSAVPTSQAMPENEAGGLPAASMMPAQSHSEADDSIGSGHNLNNVVSSHNNTPEWTSRSEPPSEHRIYPDINVSVVPGIQ